MKSIAETINASERLLPKKWKAVNLSDLVDFIRGVSFNPADVKPQQAPDHVPILRAGNLGHGLDLSNDLIWVPKAYVSKEQMIKIGDIAVCMSSGSPSVVGKTAQLNQPWEGSVGAFCGIIRPKTQEIKKYLSYWFLSPNYLNWRDKQTRGANIQNLRFSEFSKIQLRLPPLSEQERIIKIVGNQFAAINCAHAAAEVQFEAAKTLPSAYLRAVFNSLEARKWPKEKLGKHVTKVGSGITPLGGQATYMTSGIPLIRSQNVHMDRFDEEGLAFITPEQDEAMSGSRVQEDDVLLNITGASIGRVCVVPSKLCPANVNQHVSIIRSDGSIDPQFLSYFISNPRFQAFIMNTQAGATRQALTKILIENFEIYFPDLSEQKRIASLLSAKTLQAHKLVHILEDNLSDVSKLPASVLRKAFNGEL